MPNPADQPGVFIEEIPAGIRTIPGVSTAVTAFIGGAAQGPIDSPARIHGIDEYEAIFGAVTPTQPVSDAVAQFFLNGGRDAIVSRVATANDGTITGTAIRGDLATRSGLYALEAIDLFNFLCLPPPASDLDLDVAIWAEAADYCRQRQAILLIDAPASWAASPAAGLPAIITDWKAAFTSTGNAALYFPRLRIPDPQLGVEREVATAGAVAGLIARLDATQGIWKSPAGTNATFSGVADLAVHLSDQVQAEVNAIGLNCLRRLPQASGDAAAPIVIWGARTLQASGDWRYLSVRRMALFIEESIRRGTSWVAFEANEANLWAHLRQTVTDFMDRLFRQGAFPGLKASDAYFVKCGADTTAQDQLDQGNITIVVGFAPLRPAEFILLKITQTTEPR